MKEKDSFIILINFLCELFGSSRRSKQIACDSQFVKTGSNHHKYKDFTNYSHLALTYCLSVIRASVVF